MRPVVAVGLRPGALDAADRLGRPVAAAVEAPPGPVRASRLARVTVEAFDAPPARWARVADALRGLDPAAVVALTERSVVPAAHLRAALGLPGLSVEAARNCSDKRAMKRAVRDAGLPCARFVGAEDGLSGAEIVDRLGLPLVLKTAVGSGGRGTVVVREPGAMPARLEAGWMAEAFVDGVEMSVEALVAGGEVVFVNPTQYLEPAWASLVPAQLERGTLEAVRGLEAAARAALGVADGITHLELFLTPDGPVFSEMAARPPGGHLMPLMALAYGADPWEALLRAALGEPAAFPAPERAAAVRILHPWPGVVRAVEGLDAARSLPGVEAVSVRVRPGDVLGAREGTGQEAGHILVVGDTAGDAEARLEAAAAAVRIEVG